jgi:PhzF family phenazine biosynthesis protein
MGVPIIQVDAFTNVPYRGNPAGVCLLPEPAPEPWMQAVAAEMNLAETAFLVPVDDGYNLRWFTPAVEVDLCGHATLGSAHALWAMGHLSPAAPARFHTKSGLLTCRQQGDWIEMDFPAEPAQPAAPPPQLLPALGITPDFVGQNRMDYLVEVDSEATLRQLRPNHNLLADIPTRGVIVTSRAAGGDYDFVSRFFAPAVGINEDPVTGSAHCCLGPYWQNRLGKDNFVAYQASQRGGVVKVQVKGERVLLGGQAVITIKGELL